MMKICYVITKSNWGGAQRYVYDLATGLTGRQANLPSSDFEVTVVHGGAGALSERLSSAGIRTISLSRLDRNINPLNDLLAFLELVRLFKKERPDVIHLNSSKIGGLGALAGRIYNLLKPKTYHLKPARIIFTTHGWAFNEARPNWQKKTIAFLHWLTIKLCHQVITVSETEKEQVAEWPKIKGKVTAIHNGVGQMSFLYRDTARDNLIARQPALEHFRNQFWIGTIAELHPNKDLVNAIGAVALLKRNYPEIRYLVIGEGEQREKLQSMIEQFGLEKNVFLLGAIPEAAKYLKAFDIFLLNSRKEGLPYVILEAGLAGVPVVATAVGGIPEVITNGQTGTLIPSENAEATAEALEALMANGLQREILGRNLETLVRKDFSLEQMVEKTVAIYKSF